MVVSFLLTLLPILVILLMLVLWKKPADLSGLAGWAVICVVAFFAFQTSVEVLARSTVAGFIRSFPVSLIVAASLLQMAFLEKTGALRRIIIFLKTIATGDKAIQIMMINIGFGTLMVAVGATPVSILPPILIAMGYSTYQAIALPAIGYDALCTYALLGAPLVAFQGIASGFLKSAGLITVDLTLSDIGMVFYLFLPLVSMLIGFSMLWITGKGEAIRKGWLPCVISGVVIGVVAYFTNRYENFVILTGILCGLAVIVTMALLLKAKGRKVIDVTVLTAEERAFAAGFPLWKAFLPWGLLVLLILALNVPKDLFQLFYSTLKFPLVGLTANGAGIDTRFLWQAYTWILVSTVLSALVLRPTGKQLKETFSVWWKRAPRPVFAAAIFFSIGEILNMSGFDMTSGKFTVDSMVKVLADVSAQSFQGAYGAIVSFIGLFGGFITGSEASTIAMFAKYSLLTAKTLGLDLHGVLIITAAMAFGGGLASVISPAKLQNAAASIDKTGQEHTVIKVAFGLALLLTAVTALYTLVLLWIG